MLDRSNLTAFLATTDASRTRAFYEGVLGLRFVSDEPFALVYDAQGTELRIQKVERFTARSLPHRTRLVGSHPSTRSCARSSREAAASNAIPRWPRMRPASGRRLREPGLPGWRTPTATCFPFAEKPQA